MRGGSWGNAIMVSIVHRLGLRVAYVVLVFVVPYFYIFAPQARRALTQYYRLIQPKQSFLFRQWRVMTHLYQFAQILVDQVFQAAKEDFEFEMEYLGGDILKSQQSGRAGVMLFSHFGGWAVASQRFSRRQLANSISLIRYQPEGFSAEDVFSEKITRNLNTILVRPGEPIFLSIHSILRDGGKLAIMGDRPFDNNFELKKFLGKLAPVPATPFRLAKIYKTQLSFVLGFRRGFGRYGLVTETLDMKNLTLDQAMEQYLSFLETYIREYPSQWFNLYPYWSSVPTLPDGQVCRPEKNDWKVQKPMELSSV